MATVGNLGSVEYDIVANDKSSAGLASAGSAFVVTAGDIVKAISSVSGALTEFDNKNATLNADLGITALTLGMNAEELRGWAAELSGPTDSIQEMSAVLDILARQGLTTHDDLMTAAEGFDSLADAVGVSSDTLTSQMVPAFNAMGISLTEVGQYSDVLAYTMNATGVTVQDFAGAVKRAGPELAAAGVGMDDLSALMIILKDRGYDSKNMMSELTMATGAQADANDDGKVSLDEMLASMRISNDELTATRTRVADASAGYTELAAGIRNQNVPMQEQYNNSIDNTILGLGGLTLPLTSAASLIGNFASTISTIAIPAMILFPEALGTISAGISGFISGAAAELSAAGATIAGSMVAGVAGGIALGLAGVWVLLQTGVLQAFDDLGRWIESSPIGNTIMTALQVVLAPIGSLGAGIIELVKGNFSGIGDAMAAPMSVMLSHIQNAFTGIGAAFGAMAGQLYGVFEQLMAAISTLIESSLGGFYNLGANIIVSMVNGIMAASGSLAGSVVGAAGGVAQTAVDTVKSIPVVGGIAGALGFAEGGVVPGPVGAPVPAIVHGGETVIPVGGSGAGDTFNITVNGGSDNADTIARTVMSMIQAEQTSKRKQRGGMYA